MSTPFAGFGIATQPAGCDPILWMDKKPPSR